MLTLFTIPKAYQGHIGDIQRNALKSWTLLQPDCEVILMGDDEGTGEAATEMGVRHIPDLNRNEFGTPLLDHAFQLADAEAKNPFLCYVNADMILMGDLVEALVKVQEHSKWFLMTARRWNLELSGHFDFAKGWQDGLLKDVYSRGHLGHNTEIDFWVYPRGLLTGIPPLAVGRMAFECWCLYKARAGNADLIDATGTVVSVHQNHDYAHHPQGREGIGTSIEAQRNRELVGGKPYFFTIRDRTHVLKPSGLKRSRDGWWLWRSLRTSQVLPASVPLPAKILARGLNAAINAARDLAVLVLRGRSRLGKNERRGWE